MFYFEALFALSWMTGAGWYVLLTGTWLIVTTGSPWERKHVVVGPLLVLVSHTLIEEFIQDNAP